MPTKRLRAAIVGGGIGGLSAANALLLRGIDVTVFEQVDTLREVGTGVSIFPNGRRQLERMGLQEALAQVGAKVGDGSEYYRMDGTVVGRILTTDFGRLEWRLWNAPGRSVTCTRGSSPPNRDKDSSSLHRVRTKR